MKFKSLLAIAALALTITGIASAKSWGFTVDNPITVGASKLTAGQYQVKVDGTQAVLTSEEHGTSVKVPVTVEHADKKFDNTFVETETKDGKIMIHTISLGGSNTRLVVNE